MEPSSDFDVLLHPDKAGARLERWRHNVGKPVALDVVSSATDFHPASARYLLIVSWNVWIGRGRVQELVHKIRAGAFPWLGATAGAPLVILLQEAYRAGESVPPTPRGRSGRLGFPGSFRPEEEIVHLAHSLGFSLRYVPSMRNGNLRSDRGNAILSSLPLQQTSAFELPLVVQRRVTVGATVVVPPPIGPPLHLRVYSAHFDPRGASGQDLLGVAGRAAQARTLVEAMMNGDGSKPAAGPIVLGADLNLGRGRREPAYRELCEAGFTLGLPAHEPTWRHTFHRVPRLALDYLLFYRGAPGIQTAVVHRLDESPGDAGPYVFGSDHHPLLALVDLGPPRADAP